MIRSTSEPSKRNCEVVDAWMDGSMAADVEETVLYELLVRAEWPCEHEAQPWASNELVTTTFVKKLCSSLSVPWWFVLHYAGYRHISSSSSLSAGLVRLSSLQMNWKLMLSSNLKLLAVIQDQNIEIRSSKDDFGSVVGRCAVPRDAFPQWRNICWNWDGTLLAHSDSSGHVFIFDLIGNLLFNIVPAAGCTGDLSQAVAGMVFLKCDDDRWSAQLLVITFHGLLTSYLIGLNTSQGYKETHRFSFRHQYPRGINTAVYNLAHRVLLVVGSKSGDAGTSATEACGLTLWRVLSGPPHYKLIESDYVDVGKSQLKVGWWRWFGAILPASRTQTHDAILKLSLSPSGASLAALHESGKLSLWNVPSMTLRHTWHQEQQPDFDVINPVWRNPVNRRTKIPGLASVPLLLDVKWWSEDALILVRCSGALTISSCVDLQNLLGRSCEWFEPSPAISAAFDGGFLTLECESKHSYLKRPRPDKHGLVGQQKDNDGEEEEEEEKRGDGEAEESSVMSRCGRLVRHSLYYVTESERFSPPRKRPRSMVHTYRLIKLKSTTPQELYQRKIDSEEYGEALQLAQVYGLDTDLVYQQQWRRKPVSIISIQDYLTKIRKPEWVLHECLERVPENVDAAKELLLYGLEGTGLDALTALADGERHDRFVIPGDFDLPEISYEDLEGEPEIEEELLCRHQQEREKWLLARVNFSNLTLGQRDLCRCRLRLLNFLERLTTYEEILGGPQAAEHLYNAEFFKTFRSQNLLMSARNYARSGDWQALETLFLFHGEELRKQRLPLLSCFPETTSPHEYRTLLPEVGFWSNGQDKLEVIPLQQHKHREPDWSENMELRALLEVRSGDLCEFIFEEEPELRPFCGDDLSVEQVSSWYRQRACHIEAHSHQVDCALSLLRLGVERGVPGLDDLLEELVTLETLVYEAGAEPTFTLENLQQMEDVARLRLLMLNVSVGDFVRDAFRWLVPFLQRVQARDGSSNSLLHQYLLGLASNDLTCPRLVFQNSTPVRVQRVITDDALLMELALECVYACTRTDQLALCYDILECLPQRKPRKDSKVMKTLHDRVDLLERHLRVVDILEKYGVHRPVSYVRDSQSDVELAQDLLTYLARLAGRRKPALTESQWEQLLQDMLEMQQTVYTCMRPEVCREIYVESLLCSGRIETLRLAGQRLQCLESSVAQGRHVLYKRSLQLVLQAAREYFNSASSHKDENLELARECLNLIKDHPPAIQEEQDLILSLNLLSEFHVKALPLQVRLCEDRLQLIKQCISQSPTIYKCPGKLLLLASLLRVPDSTGDNCGGPVLILLAEQALRSEDVAGASQLCQQLVKKGYQGAWSVCSRVGSCNDCTDTSIRRNFLTFALAHCPPDFLQDLLVKSCSLQAQILYESINVRSKTFAEEDDAVVLELKTEPEEKKGLEERHKEDQEMEPEGNKNRFVGWTSPAGKLLQQTTERTVSIFSKSTQSTCEVLQALTQPQWWCKSLAYHRPLQGHQLETEASHSLAEELLHATKLAETSYGQEPCSATEVLLQLAEESFPRDVAMALAYLLAVSEPEAVDAWWEKHVPSEPDLQLAIYYYCLQLYANLITPLSVPQALYEAHPTEVVQEVLSAVMFPLEGMACPHVQHLVKRLRQACERFADFLQAQSLLNLGCGVDVERFAQDADYKRQTILGLAESLEEEPLQLALTLARRYEVPSWEVFLSHTEFLLADNGLSASEVEERITAQDLPGELRNQPEAVLARLACVVFPSLSGRDHARLCTYFGLLKACGCTSHTTHPGQPEAHFQLLQKLHSIAPGLDYKQLVMGESPLEAVRSELTAQNVSALATLLAELPGGPAHSVPVSTLFCNWLHLLFWQGGSMKGDDDASVNETPRHVLSVPTDQRSTEEIQNGQIGETEWLFRFSECEQLMHKMDPPDIGTFLQSICASPHAVSQLLLKVRREILERSMLLVRHLAKMKEDEEEIGGEAGYMTVLQQLQDWKSHLDSLDSDVIQALKHNPEARLRDLVKAYDEACSLPDGVRRVALKLALAAQPVNQVNALLELCTRGHVCSVQDVLQEAVRTVLEALRENLKTTTEEEQIEVEQPMDVLDGLVTSIRRHKEEGGKLVSGEDLLGWLRPFCCDEAVPTMQRARVLQLLDRAFPLEEHDLRLLLCYRTKTVLQHSWPERMLKEEEIESEERRLDLFNELLVSKTTTKQLQQLLLLLQAWPAFQPSVLVNERCPWLQLLAAMLNSKPEIQELEQQFERDRPCEEGQHLVAAVREQARTKHPLPYMCLQHLMLLLEKNGFLLLAVCLGLDSNTNELQELALHYATKFSSVEASACSTKLLPIVLSRQLLSACLPTPLYPALAAQLSREKDELSSEAVTQLQDSGQHLHAASMLMAVRGTHPGLTTLSAALALHHCSP